MDWREEIKEVTRQIRWLPEAVDGESRELEWLTNMRDWMISKKRFWGLALPIWVDEETGDFEVIGSLEELRERAVEGWDDFDGHTPHRPWIDGVKIAHPETGNVMSRIPDVGNPWLDAGIVPFSTMQYNSDRQSWAEQYPADFVTECFPGQFRNWFYAMLAMATMMDNSPPFRNLLGHRLVMNESGQPMHKSDGTAIWLEEAAEQLGVDTMRWMYLAQNPAIYLRFGPRHPDQPPTTETPHGPLDHTAEGVPTCQPTTPPLTHPAVFRSLGPRQNWPPPSPASGDPASGPPKHREFCIWVFSCGSRGAPDAARRGGPLASGVGVIAGAKDRRLHRKGRIFYKCVHVFPARTNRDRKRTRVNSSHW